MSNYSVLDFAADEAKKWLEGLDQRSVGATASLQDLKARFRTGLPDQGMSSEAVIDHIVKMSAGGNLGCASGRFFAWVIGGALPSALAADWLTSTWDQNAALYACGPAVSVIEEAAGEWIKGALDLPRDASFAFTTGCQLAHFTCLAAARASVLKQAGWNINENGLFGAPTVRILASDQRHASIDRAVRYLGFGNRSIETLPSDHEGKLIAKDFQDVLEKTNGPKILVLDAADLNIAAFDPFDELIPLAKASGAWVHIDGAFGLFARASRDKRHLTRGIELADSWATDAHKWLNVPFDCGIAIVRDRESHRDAMTTSASYISAEKQARDQIDWNPEWSRRARGVPVYAALMELGREGLEDLIDRTSRHCHSIVTGISKLPSAKMLWEPKLNQGLVRFMDENAGATEKDHDRRTDAVIAAVNATGEAFFSGTTWNGIRAMRVSVVNWRTTDEDVRRTIEAVSRVLEKGKDDDQ